MLKFRVSPGSGAGAVATGRGRGQLVRVAAVVGTAGLVGLVSTTLVRVQRLRRTAAHHAHDLERTGVVGTTAGEPLRLVVLGDSAARGYGLTDAATALPHQVASRLAAATGRGVAVTSLATDGHRTADVLAHQVPDLPVADAVVVSVGVNDALGRTPGRVLAAVTGDLLAAVVATAGPRAVVVLVACPDLAAAPGFPRPLGLAVGWRGRRVARVQQAVATDLDVPVVPLPRPDATLFGPDGFHPGVGGHAAMAELATRELLAHAPAGWHRPAANDPHQEPAWT